MWLSWCPGVLALEEPRWVRRHVGYQLEEEMVHCYLEIPSAQIFLFGRDLVQTFNTN